MNSVKFVSDEREVLIDKPSKKGILSQNWWVILFAAACGVVYSSSMQKKQLVIASLDQRLEALREEKTQLLEQNQELQLQIHSQSDPAWIQLTLMKGLGLVPEGQSKVYFYNEPPSVPR